MVRRTAAGCAAHDLSSQHRAGRQPPRGNYAVRHGARVCVSGGPAGLAVSARGPHRHRPGGLRGGCGRDACTRSPIRSTRSIIFPRDGHSETFRQLTAALAKARGSMQPLFWPGLAGPFHRNRGAAGAAPRQFGPRRVAAESILPYLVWNTVFDNARVVAEMGRAPAPFSSYCFPLFRFARENHFRYPYREWPEAAPVRGRPPRKADTIQSGTSRWENARHDGSRAEAWVAALIERTKVAWMLGRGQILEAGRAAETAFCRLQRHAQHRLGCARRGDAAAGAAGAGRQECRELT